MNNRKIVITQMPISTSKEDIKLIEITNPDIKLVTAIFKKMKSLKAKNKEVFMLRNNLLVAEDGWHIALFEDELELMAKTE